MKDHESFYLKIAYALGFEYRFPGFTVSREIAYIFPTFNKPGSDQKNREIRKNNKDKVCGYKHYLK